MKIFRERAGVMAAEPMWVCIANGHQVAVNSSLARLLDAVEPRKQLAAAA